MCYLLISRENKVELNVVVGCMKDVKSVCSTMGTMIGTKAVHTVFNNSEG